MILPNAGEEMWEHKLNTVERLWPIRKEKDKYADE